jgi:hypothetical protein
VGGTGHGDVATDSVFKPSSGDERPTTRAANGCAGGGGGGGEGDAQDGGAGGGGGGGGQGGAGGYGGAGGGASIGIWLYHTATAAEIVANTIHTSAGGDGNLGGAGGNGGAGGSGGAGRVTSSSGGNGGRGGDGARGGNGSQGGGGGGGPSYGIFVGPDMAPMVSSNVIQTDQGGRGGDGGNGGDGGWSYGVYAVDAGVGCCLPTLLQNSITFGQAGVAGVGQDFGDGVDHDGVDGQNGVNNW